MKHIIILFVSHFVFENDCISLGTMVSTTTILLTLPKDIQDQTEFLEQIHQLTPHECEGMLRMGLYGIHLFKQGFCTTDMEVSWKETYEREMTKQQQERMLYEQWIQTHQETWFEQRLQPYVDTMERQTKEYQCLQQQMEDIKQQSKYHQEQWNLCKEQVVRYEEKEHAWIQMKELQVEKLVKEAMKQKQDELERWKEMKDHEVASLQKQLIDCEFRTYQQDKEQMIKLQENLQNTKEMLLQARTEIEEWKRKELVHTMEEQQKQYQELHQLLLTTTKTSSVGLGQIGEKYLFELVQSTFQHMEEFDIEDKTKIPHSGDFHVRFKDFSILVDAKNFAAGKVSKGDLEKFHRDMEYHPSIKIGWLVSLQGYIPNTQKQPFVFQVVNGQLLVYINHLQHQTYPKEVLEHIFYSSSFLYHHVLHAESTMDIVHKYKRYEKRIKEHVEKMQKLSKRTLSSIQQVQEHALEMETHIMSLLQDDLLHIRDEHTSMVETWWKEHVQQDPHATIKSNVLYDAFKLYSPETSMTNDMFKMILKAWLPKEHVQIPSKQKYQYTIVGYRLIEKPRNEISC
jgi:hypothetical protein